MMKQSQLLTLITGTACCGCLLNFIYLVLLVFNLKQFVSHWSAKLFKSSLRYTHSRHESLYKRQLQSHQKTSVDDNNWSCIENLTYRMQINMEQKVFLEDNSATHSNLRHTVTVQNTVVYLWYSQLTKLPYLKWPFKMSFNVRLSEKKPQGWCVDQSVYISIVSTNASLDTVLRDNAGILAGLYWGETQQLRLIHWHSSTLALESLRHIVSLYLADIKNRYYRPTS